MVALPRMASRAHYCAHEIRPWSVWGKPRVKQPLPAERPVRALALACAWASRISRREERPAPAWPSGRGSAASASRLCLLAEPSAAGQVDAPGRGRAREGLSPVTW